MPIYDYKCECGKTKENHIVIKWNQDVKCKCGKQMKKMLSAPNLHGFINGSSK